MVLLFFSTGYCFTPHITNETRNQYKSQETILIAEKGIAKLPIIISQSADKTVKESAEELSSYLEKITGVIY